MDSMMYTKEEESVVTLTGGSPWGFTIRTQAGNGYTRGRVVVAKVVQGGTADRSGTIHVGDEIIAVNGFEFDNEQQATEYVRGANEELILKVKRGQDKRRMNIRLAGELPNYYATALESPVEKSLYRDYTNMFSNNVNNKRSSKEYEKDLSYKVSSDTANAIIDYQSGHLGQSSELYKKSIRLTRSTTDLPNHLNISRDQPLKDDLSRAKHTTSSFNKVIHQKINISNRPRLQRQYTWSGRGSPPWKSYNPPPSPDKVQRVRIRSTNVTSPDHYKCSSDKSSPTMDESQKHSESRSPGYSGSTQKPFSFSVTEDLNRTWPSAASADISRQDIRLASHKSYSVSAAKSHFEQMSQSSYSDPPDEIDRRQKPSSSSSLAPKPPSRNSSFRSSRLSSSPVFQDGGSTKTTSETKATPNRQNSFPDKSRYLAYEKDIDSVPVRKDSSSEDLDKPLPPRRFSQSKVLNSFRSSKKPAYQASTTGPSAVYEHNVEQLERSPETAYHHGRTQSLPSSKLVAMHLSSKSWVADEGKKSLGSKTQDFSLRSEFLPRSSSFSRARVVETSSVKSVLRDDSRSSTITKPKSTTRNYRSEIQPGVIQALRTGEISSETKNKLRTELRSKSTPYLKQESSNERQDTKTELFTLKQSKTNVKKAELSIPVLKENSIIQRLLLESQPQSESNVHSKVAAIKEEISQRTDNAKSASKTTTVVKTESVAPIQQQRPVSVAPSNEVKENLKLKDPIVSPEDVSKKQNKKEDETDVEESERPPQTNMNNSKNVKQSAAKVDRYLDKLMGKLDSPPVNRRPFPPVIPEKIDSPSLVVDDVFHEPLNNGTEVTTNRESETQLVENNVESSESAPENPASGLVISKNERNREIDSPSPEIIVKSDDPEVVVESYPSTILKDDNDNISESILPEKTERRVNDGMKKTIELKDCNSQLLSPKDKSVKVIHSRENSASSLLEETLESAKTIASIYSVELSTRCVDGEDSLSTASEMRRYSLAKRVVRRKPKKENESSFNIETERAGDQLNQSLSTPEKFQSSFIDSGTPIDENEAEDESGNRSTGSLSSSGSRPGSGIISPKLEALEEQKELLISSMKMKVELLKEQESEINDEMKQNDDLGKRVAQEVKEKTCGTEFSKFELFVGELNNIIGLLLSLTQRMHRYEVLLEDIDLAEENGRDNRDVLLKRIDRVKQQYDEACCIKEINDKRGETVAKFVEEYCSDEEFADFQHFVDMKTQLALTQAEIRDKIKLGEEKLNALTSTQIDWSSFNLNSK